MAKDYKTPIVHGVGYSGEIPYKCQNCMHKQQDENGRWICDRHDEGKFVGLIGYACFKAK